MRVCLGYMLRSMRLIPGAKHRDLRKMTLRLKNNKTTKKKRIIIIIIMIKLSMTFHMMPNSPHSPSRNRINTGPYL